MTCYFDPAYFDPAYFDVCVKPVTTGGAARRRYFVAVWEPSHEEDESELLEVT
jgi:hypothetical protein